MAHTDLWIAVLKRLQPTIKKADFLTWFQNTVVVSNESGVLTVGVPTAFARDWIANKYNIKVLQAAAELDGEVKEIKYEIDGRLNDHGQGAVDVKVLFDDDEKKVRKVKNQNEVRVSRGFGQTIGSEMLNNRYKLDNFVVGLDNRLPHAASQAVASMPGGIYNPLYIYGKVGLGKTHLLQAIGNEMLKHFPDKVVQYMTAEKFVSEVVDAITKRYMKQFKERYRHVDCLLIDDIQFFSRKNSSQQEFFYTFNELYQNNKQIVLTSDRAPSELEELDERLKSRFAMGMVVELLPPDYETRVAILNQKCKEFQIILDPSVIDFIANNVSGSVRELEGIIRQLLAEDQLFDRVATIRCAAEIIKRMNKAQKIIGYDLEASQNRSVIRNAQEVIDIVADYYKLSVDDLTGDDRHREFMWPRQICMYLIKQELGDSYEKIGLGFGGKNHTTIMHACHKTASRLKKDLRLIREVNAIKKEMGL